jgi:hypothetical protein
MTAAARMKAAVSDSTERSRRSRQRNRAGKAVLEIEVDLAELADALVGAGFLEQWSSEDRPAIQSATEKFLAFLIAHRGDL